MKSISHLSSRYDALYRTFPNMKHQKRKSALPNRSMRHLECQKWFIFDPELAIPEIFVEYTLGTKPKNNATIEHILYAATSAALADPLLPATLQRPDYMSSMTVRFH
jgi:hypothetical protein